jgi:alkylation response protein AidB-like acyl-CoA dehydrogenase
VDLRETPEMAAMRAEIREALAAVLPADWHGSGFLPMDVRPEHMELARRLDTTLAERKLLAPAWPVKYGGRGLTPFEQFALFEELGYALAPRLTTVSVDLVGPVLIHYGTDGQRRQHLPAIANAAAVWSQGFSEPLSGSDLTSLRTRADRNGDVYVVNGQKIWTSMAHVSDWIILLARTGDQESRGRGLSLLLVPTDSPGIEIRPLVDATGERMLNEVFFDNVQVPVQNLVGEENEGWRYATTLLQYERGDALLVGQFRRLLDDLERAVRDGCYGRRNGTTRPADRPPDHARHRHQVRARAGAGHGGFDGQAVHDGSLPAPGRCRPPPHRPARRPDASGAALAPRWPHREHGRRLNHRHDHGRHVRDPAHDHRHPRPRPASWLA